MLELVSVLLGVAEVEFIAGKLGMSSFYEDLCVLRAGMGTGVGRSFRSACVLGGM